jgi:hypothetical protein
MLAGNRRANRYGERKDMNSALCERCGKQTYHHDLIHYTLETGSLALCTQCFNADVAERSGIDHFDNHILEPISIVDTYGKDHTFHFQVRLMGAEMLVIDAFELEDGVPAGYRFQSVGEPGGDRFTQLGHLVQKIHRALSISYLEDTAHGLQIKGMDVRGHIEADLSDDRNASDPHGPMLLIDGREISWDEFGRMLMTFEGFQFKLEIADQSDDMNI